MKRQEIFKINEERLKGWNKRLTNVHSTPVFMLGVGHDHNLGQLTVLTTEDINDTQLLTFIEYAAKQLREQIARNN